MKSKLSHFSNCEKGNVGFLTAGSLLLILPLVAGGIELNQHNKLKRAMQHAADTAVMSAFDGSNRSWSRRIRRADRFFEVNFKHSKEVGRVSKKLSGKENNKMIVFHYKASAKAISIFGELNPLSKGIVSVSSSAIKYKRSKRPPRLFAPRAKGNASS